MEPVLKIEGLSKIFPRVIANDNISFELQKGELLALLGENGAGKSTLMNCLYGLYQPTKGNIYIEGKAVNFKNRKEAESLGIGMVHQHFMLFEELTVAENIILGKKTGLTPYLRIRDVEDKVKALSNKYEFNLNPKSKIKNLSVGMRQRVEILKMLFRDTNILIFDEATAVLTPIETIELFKTIKKFLKEGKSVLMITHKLKEVMDLADKAIVLKDGKVAGSVDVSDTSEDELAHMMVGREVSSKFEINPPISNKVIIRLDSIWVKSNIDKMDKLKNISFEIKEGEVFGIAGVDGNGQKELEEVITGLNSFYKGSITFLGHKNVGKINTKKMYELGMSYIPQDRQERGLVLEMNVEENLALEGISRRPFSRNGIINFKYLKDHGGKMIKEFNIKAFDSKVKAQELSGGNQQKIILAREISRSHKFLIAIQPTRGLDIGATEFIRKKIIEEKEKGTAVLLISTELDEIFALSNKIAVINKGEIMGILDAKDATTNKIGMMMAGLRGRLHGDKD